MNAFEFAAPGSESEILDLLSAEPGDTELLAGGTDLIGLMKKMIITPRRVVNIMEVASLKTIEVDEHGGVVIGAAVTLDDVLASRYLENYPAITQAILGINSMQLQCQGTFGGEICQRPRCWFFRNGRGLLADHGRLADEGDNRFHAIFGNSGPAKFVSSSRVAPALVALNARFRILGPSQRDVQYLAAADFFRIPRHEHQRENVLLPNQLLTHILLPPLSGASNATYEVRDTEGPDYPLTSAAVALQLNNGMVGDARIVLGQVAPIPWISEEAGGRLLGRRIDQRMAAAAGDAAVAQASPLTGNQYKVQLAKVAVQRALLYAVGQQTEGFTDAY